MYDFFSEKYGAQYGGQNLYLDISVLIFKEMPMSQYPWLRTSVYNGAYLGCVSECRSVAAN